MTNVVIVLETVIIPKIVSLLHEFAQVHASLEEN
jgi:hypothetical protein